MGSASSVCRQWRAAWSWVPSRISCEQGVNGEPQRLPAKDRDEVHHGQQRVPARNREEGREKEGEHFLLVSAAPHRGATCTSARTSSQVAQRDPGAPYAVPQNGQDCCA